MSDRGVLDGILRAADKTLQEIESLLGLFDRSGVVKTLRELANSLDRLPMLESDVRMLRGRLRALQSTDPDKTPRVGISTQIAAVRPDDKK